MKNVTSGSTRASEAIAIPASLSPTYLHFRVVIAPPDPHFVPLRLVPELGRNFPAPLHHALAIALALQPLYRSLTFFVVIHIRLNQSANTEHGELLELMRVAGFIHGVPPWRGNA
jgi:hypothetical protein